MKKIITTTALALSVFVASASNCRATQGSCAEMKPSPNAKLLSSKVEGGCRVSRWLVPEKSSDDRDFSLHYQINISRMISSYDRNSNEITGLRNFLAELMADNQKSITSINITGYSSPDGSATNNLRLATARARDCRQYINREYKLSKYTGETQGVVYKWSDTKSAVESSSIPQKSSVLRLIESGMSESAIETRLRTMPSSWSYMVKNILPKMRSVVMEVVYSQWCIEEVRTPIKRTEKELIENNYIFILNEREPDLSIVENGYAVPIDYEPKERSRFVYKENRRREKVKGYFIDSSGRERSTVKYK